MAPGGIPKVVFARAVNRILAQTSTPPPTDMGQK